MPGEGAPAASAALDTRASRASNTSGAASCPQTEHFGNPFWRSNTSLKLATYARLLLASASCAPVAGPSLLTIAAAKAPSALQARFLELADAAQARTVFGARSSRLSTAS